MSIFLFLLMASVVCCTNASENRNKEEIVDRRLKTSNKILVLKKKKDYENDGGETEQNPKDPKYQKLAREIVYDHMHMKHEDVKKIIVSKVTTQVVSGTITRIKLQIILNSGEKLICDTETLEQPWKKVKQISYRCRQKNPVNSDEESKGESSNEGANSNDSKPPHDDKARFHELGRASVKDYFKNQLKNEKIEEVKIINIAYVTTPVLRRKIMYINLEVTARPHKKFICSALYVLPSYDSLSTDCILNKNIDGNYQWVDPSKEKYLDLAEKAMFNSRSVNQMMNASRHEIIVTFALEQVVAGYKYSIKFIIHPVNDPEYDCQTHVWEKTTGKDVIESLNCQLRPNQSESEPSNKDENKYHEIGKKIIKDRLQNQPHVLYIVEIKVKNVAYVTTQVQRQKIMYINFDVIVRSSNNRICSVLFVMPSTEPFSTDCVEVKAKPGGFQWKDPSDEKYLAIAEKATNPKWNAMDHDTIVTFVVQQVVAGAKDRIDFIARPVHGHEYKCRINVLEKTSGQNIVQDLTCHLNEEDE